MTSAVRLLGVAYAYNYRGPAVDLRFVADNYRRVLKREVGPARGHDDVKAGDAEMPGATAS